MKEKIYKGLIDELADDRIRLGEFYIDDYFAEFIGKEVEITIKEIETKKRNKEAA